MIGAAFMLSLVSAVDNRGVQYEAPALDPTESADAGPSSPAVTTAGTLRAVVVPPNVPSELPDEDRALFEERLLGGLDRGGFDVVPPAKLRDAGFEPSSCPDNTCAEALGREYDATHVVFSTVRVEDRDYSVVVELADVSKAGEVIASSTQSCEICGSLDAAGLIETAAAVLRTKLDALAVGPTILIATSTPEGAIVKIDGEIVGVTPLERAIPSGKHLLRVEADGYISLEREVTFVEGAQESLDLSLEPLPSRLPPARWGWASVASGLVLLGGGGALAWLDRRPQTFRCSETDGTKDRLGNCKYLWNTRWYAAGSLATGGALLSLGVIILVEARTRSSAARTQAWHRNPRRPRLGVSPRGLSLSGRF